MNTSIRSKLVAAGAVMLGAFGLTQAAQAHTDVVFSVGIPAYVEPAPVYVAPQPVYVAPQPEYVAPRWVYERERERELRREAFRREQWRRWHRWNERHERHEPVAYGYYDRY